MANSSAGTDPATLIRGVVVGPDARPVTGARVAFTGSPVPVPEIAALTDEQGRFHLLAPVAGEYSLAAHGEDATGVPLTAAAVVTIAPAAGAPESEQSREPPPAADAAFDPDESVGSDDVPRAASHPSILQSTRSVQVELSLAPVPGKERP